MLSLKTSHLQTMDNVKLYNLQQNFLIHLIVLRLYPYNNKVIYIATKKVNFIQMS